MIKWNALVLTCPNKNSSLAYQKEIKLKQQKGLIDKESLVICIDDPGNEPCGSGGATLNALLVVAESLSSKYKYKITQAEVLKEKYILIMHMGRHYSFDVSGKAWCALPYQDLETNNIVTNFDLLYKTITNQVAKYSDPGVYVCSTDMLLLLNDSERITIKESQICVISALASKDDVRDHGIYEIDDKNFVKNIYYQPDENILNRVNRNGFYNLITGVVYFNYEVAQTFYSLLLFSPIDACSYIGIDSGATSLSLSLFFDILLATCDGIEKDAYINGLFKTNLNISKNSLAVIKQARSILFDSLRNFNIKNISLDQNKLKYSYMDNDNLAHRIRILSDSSLHSHLNENIRSIRRDSEDNFKINFLNLNSVIEKKHSESSGYFLNDVFQESKLKYGRNSILLNCHFKSSNVEIGNNTILNDIELNNININYPPELFIQNVEIMLECFKTKINLNIVFGVNDNLMKEFNKNDWTIMNLKWSDFVENTLNIDETDLWPSNQSNVLLYKNLINAKLFPIMHLSLKKNEMDQLRQNFWIDFKSQLLISHWKQSVRVSFEDIIAMNCLEELFKKRRNIHNLVNSNHFVNSVIQSKPTKFLSLIRNAIHDGYANELLKLLEESALKNSKDLMLLPRIMVFISNTLCEMAISHSFVRSGPSLNSCWNYAFQLIDDGKINQALIELQKERLNWMNRDDLLIRASRHYEGATLSFIRQATSSFSSAESNPIVLEKIDEKNSKKYEYVEAIAPARLDLAGAWSDTPPITYECPNGSCVTNVAILVNGVKPIGAKGRLIKPKDSSNHAIKIIMKNSSDSDDHVCFEFFSLDDFKDYNKPQAVACLVKAVCIFTKLVDLKSDENLNQQLSNKLNGSLELFTWTGLPHGSGLGTSSILIGCVLKVIWYLMGIDVSNETLSYSILVVEQIMTTNGGWQDQIGAIYGGFKFTTAKNKLPLEINVTTLNLSQEFIDIVNDHLLLVYTGLTRLAKDLLINVIRNWYSISDDIYMNVQDLIKNAIECKRALENGNLNELGNCINKHRKQKFIMAPGSEPDSVLALTNILEPYVYGMALAGAGGGGFVYILLKESKKIIRNKINTIIESLNLNMQTYDAVISNSGIEFKFNQN